MQWYEILLAFPVIIIGVYIRGKIIVEVAKTKNPQSKIGDYKQKRRKMIIKPQ